jgi:hypothetical protein
VGGLGGIVGSVSSLFRGHSTSTVIKIGLVRLLARAGMRGVVENVFKGALFGAFVKPISMKYIEKPEERQARAARMGTAAARVTREACALAALGAFICPPSLGPLRARGAPLRVRVTSAAQCALVVGVPAACMVYHSRDYPRSMRLVVPRMQPVLLPRAPA